MAYQKQSSNLLKFFIAGAVGVGFYFYLSHFSDEDREGVPREDVDLTDHSTVDFDLTDLLADVKISESADELADGMGMTMQFDDPADLVNQVMRQMSEVDSVRGVQDLAKILGNGEASAGQLEELRRLFDNQRIKLNEENPIELLGEVKAGRASRWNIHLSDRSKIQLQTSRQKDGTWKIEEVKLPLSNLDENGQLLTKEQVRQREQLLESKDSLLFASNFLKELVSQNFEKARRMVHNDTITDAKIAGLCILFEDGAYKLNEKKPLQAVRMTDEMSAFFANVDAQEGGSAQFSITTLRDDVQSVWMINEINLDRLLGDYASRVAGGDVYYTPLIKNPNGGDMLVIYFDFDSGGLTTRTEKQLDIVVNLLRLDESKKIRLSGHTDGKGSDEYNQGLSRERALAVKEYLIQNGINDDQVLTESHGFSKPIRDESNTDGVNARRANRRTEIYLDF